jgi:hypothetical protein
MAGSYIMTQYSNLGYSLILCPLAGSNVFDFQALSYPSESGRDPSL